MEDIEIVQSLCLKIRMLSQIKEECTILYHCSASVFSTFEISGFPHYHVSDFTNAFNEQLKLMIAELICWSGDNGESNIDKCVLDRACKMRRPKIMHIDIVRRLGRFQESCSYIYRSRTWSSLVVLKRFGDQTWHKRITLMEANAFSSFLRFPTTISAE